MTKLQKTILNLKSIQFACISTTQADSSNAVIVMNAEAQESLAYAVKRLENIGQKRIGVKKGVNTNVQ